MNTHKYLVTTFVKNRAQKRFWDPRKPLDIGFPVRWILERSDSGFLIKQKTGNDSFLNPKTKSRHIHLPIGITQNREPIELAKTASGNSLGLKIEPLYEPSVDHEPHPKPREMNPFSKWTVFRGRNDLTLEFEYLDGKYRGFLLGSRIFTISGKPGNYRIKPFIPGLFLRFGEEEIPLEAGKWLELKNQLSGTVVHLGPYWWKVIHQNRPLVRFDREREKIDDQDKLFNKATVSSFALTALLSFLLSLLPTVDRKFFDSKTSEFQQAPIVSVLPKTVWVPKIDIPEEKQEVAMFKQTKEPPKKKEELPEQKLKGKKKGVRESKGSRSSKKQYTDLRKEISKNSPQKTVRKNTGSAESSQKEIAAQKNIRGMISEISDLLKSKKISRSDKSISDSAVAPSNANDNTTPVSKDSKLLSSTQRAGLEKTRFKLENLKTDPNEADASNQGNRSSRSTQAKGFVNLAGNNDKDIAGRPNGKKVSSFITIPSSGTRVERGLSKEEVGAVIKRHLAEIRYCHELALLSNPKLEGKLTYEFSINRSGIVSTAELLASTFRESSLEGCLQSRLISWIFPKPKGGVKVSVTYPFLFKTLGRD